MVGIYSKIYLFFEEITENYAQISLFYEQKSSKTGHNRKLGVILSNTKFFQTEIFQQKQKYFQELTENLV